MTFKIISGGGFGYEMIEHVCLGCKVTYYDHSRCSKRCAKCRLEHVRREARERGRAKKAAQA